MPSNRPRCMATKGRDSPLGLLGAAPQRPSSKGCWARGGGQGCAWGGPSPPCYSATARQCSSCNVLGQDKREHHPSSHCQSWPEDSPKTSERKSLRSSRNYLLQAQGGRPEAGRGCCSFSAARPASWQGHLQSPSDGWKSCFSLWGTDASPSGDEKNHQPLEVPEAIWTFQLDSSGKTKPLPSAGTLQRSQSLYPVESGEAAVRKGMQRSYKGSQVFRAPTGVLPGTGRVLDLKVREAGDTWPLLEAHEMAPR